jgi:uncharacterized protein (TIGR02466 family)|tara:strand:- start:3137 stop:3724 length:588 start_codon:yes stop_codon:yes gene_type:complete
MFDIPIKKGFISGTAREIQLTWDILRDIWDSCEKGAWSGETGVSTGEQILDLHVYKEFDWIVGQMIPHVIEYWDKDLGYCPAHIQPVASWANLHIDGDFTQEHSHSAGIRQAHVASVFYLKKGEGGDIEFCDPLDHIRRFTPLAKSVDDAILSQSMPCTTGDFLLFPGWLRHRTQPAIGKRVAISINFNGNFDYN